ncbi:U6 snRNA-associated Sm-like protein LSm7 isoform X1 [Cryptotermes secundus]|uniref:U6 snRNA-associated Sm-like protein LSm7 isoform X1 n=1 Tax=Cryptotermes secundus TaxID=105785 RepID=UPI000CD7BD6F|nr:U6 snRNA-associated Sm-like protein LSm7 isoform X1 [Cryptotermes secundus]
MQYLFILNWIDSSVGFSVCGYHQEVTKSNVMAAIQGQGDQKEERKRKESILDLSKYLEKNIRVKFAGGREAAGILKGYDPLLNLVLDNTTEVLRDPDDPYKLTEDTRMLGLVVCRGTSVVLICPVDGMESIPNPFVQQDG